MGNIQTFREYAVPTTAYTSHVSPADPKTGLNTLNTINVQGKPTRAELNDAVNTANDAMKMANLNLKFSTDDSSGETVVQVVDMETKTVLRQIPSIEMLELRRAMDRMQGALLKHTA